MREIYNKNKCIHSIQTHVSVSYQAKIWHRIITISLKNKHSFSGAEFFQKNRILNTFSPMYVLFNYFFRDRTCSMEVK